MPDFHAAYPDYAATSRIDDLRAAEYSYLDRGGHTYLDYTGSGLAADAQLRAHVQRLRGGCFGNPHSENPTSAASTALIEQARAAVLGYFRAAADDYTVIFTPNATGACRLVDERAVARDASAAGISLRTGCFCNPGAGERAFGLGRRDLRGPDLRGLDLRGLGLAGLPTMDDYLRRVGLPTGGAVRVSLGLASDLGDLDRFLDWAERTYRDTVPDRDGLAPRLRC